MTWILGYLAFVNGKTGKKEGKKRKRKEMQQTAPTLAPQIRLENRMDGMPVPGIEPREFVPMDGLRCNAERHNSKHY